MYNDRARERASDIYYGHTMHAQKQRGKNTLLENQRKKEKNNRNRKQRTLLRDFNQEFEF